MENTSQNPVQKKSPEKSSNTIDKNGDFDSVKKIEVNDEIIVDSNTPLEPETVTVGVYELARLKRDLLTCRLQIESALSYTIPDELKAAFNKTLDEIKRG